MTTTLGGLRTIIYATRDLEASKAWWTGFLGFAPYFDEPFYVGFDIAGYELGLVPDGEPSEGPTTYWAVGDVAAAMSSAESVGARVREPAHGVGDGIVVGSVVTPQNETVGFIVNPHFAARG